MASNPQLRAGSHRPSLTLDTQCTLGDPLCRSCSNVLFDTTESLENIETGTVTKGEPVTSYEDDWFPQLPRLASWATRGCKLCQSIRAAARSKEAADHFAKHGVDTNYSQLVLIELEYLFNQEYRGEPIAKTPLQRSSAIRSDLTCYTTLSIVVRLRTPQRVILDQDFTWDLSPLFCQLLIGAPVAYVVFPVILQHSPGPVHVGKPVARLPTALQTDVLDLEPLSFMRTTLEKCVLRCMHIEDRPGGCGSFLPSRLLDVRKETLRVVSREAIQQTHVKSPKYLTLSYCWGSEPDQLALTQTTSQQLMSGFAFKQLAAVQQDTVRLARALSIPYVWIDSLCIQQGNLDDWSREASAMGQIYANAFITICSVSSSECQQGFLARRSTILPFSVSSLVQQRAETPSYSLRLPPYVFDSLPLGSQELERQFESSIWARRGWTFQEDALSLRCFYFTKSGIFFRCPTLTCSESTQEPTLVKTSNMAQGTLTLHNIQPPASETIVCEAWATVVYQCSKRRITRGTDWLPALSGIAKIFAKTFGTDQYVAGLWRNHLTTSLAWIANIPQSYKPRSMKSLLVTLEATPYQVPSWSWVGRTEEIRMAKGVYEGLPVYEHAPGLSEYRKLKATSTPITEDPFGQISRAECFIETHVFELQEYIYAVEQNRRGWLAPGGEDMFSTACIAIHVGGNGPVVDLSLDWPTGKKDLESCKLVLALIGRCKNPLSDTAKEGDLAEDQGWPYGLVLHPSRMHKGAYLRVGVFHVGYEVRKKSSFMEHLKFFRGCEIRTLTIV